MRIRDKSFIVTGGGSGLGAACARMLAGKGATVFLADIDSERGEALATALGAPASFYKTDVTSEASVQAVVDAAAAAGRLRGLVNCAGVLLARKVVSKRGPHDLESFSRVVNVNLIGTFNVIRLAAVALAAVEPGSQGERGVIINTASIAAFDGQIGQAAYAASKGGVVALTLPIARELSGSGIRVMTIAPGIFSSTGPQVFA